MYPVVPYQGISWPMTQHAGVLSKDVIDGLLHAGMLCAGKTADAEIINGYLVDHNILTPNVRKDRNKVDAWRDYQQILSEFGMMYSTRLSKEIRFTPVAIAYLNGRITYNELIALQVMRYQYPNGHKSQLSPSLIDSYGKNFTFPTFTELQEACHVMLKPAVLVWQILENMWLSNEVSVLSLDDFQTYIVRCTSNNDASPCVQSILNSRKGLESLAPLPRARRNMADWMKVMNQTPLFKLSADGQMLSLSSFSIQKRTQISTVCKQMCSPDTFWHFHEGDFKKSWFDFYGSFDDVTDWVLT